MISSKPLWNIPKSCEGLILIISITDDEFLSQGNNYFKVIIAFFISNNILLYEMVSGRKPSDKFMEYAQTVGFLLLISLVLFANGNDIFKAIFG